MSSPKQESDEVSSSADLVNKTGEAGGDGVASSTDGPRPPAKRPATTVIEISDTDTDDSDICAVTSYQASADEVKRIRGDEYSSTSSSSEYSSDSESAWEDDSVVLPDPAGAAGGARAAGAAQLNLRANRTEDPILNPKIKAEETIEKLATHWKEQKDLSTADIILTQEPFPLCLLHNFLSNPEIINNIVDDMNTLDWTRKKMDLYEFHQTADLATLTWQRSIRGIYELLKTDVMSWVSSVTGLTLTNVSASCSLYGPGDHLLVHDDLLGDRRVAFILYLAPWTPSAGRYCVRQCENGNGEDKDDAETIEIEDIQGWSAHMGGALQLLGTDSAGAPAAARRVVCPRNNMLALFPVSPASFHQVGEVVSLELPRLSINGWFHGPAPAEADPAPPAPPPPPVIPCKPHSEPFVLPEWVSAAYMSPRARAAVQAQVEARSEVCLRRFLQPAQYQQLVHALQAPDLTWEWCGPSNQRHYRRLVPPSPRPDAPPGESPAPPAHPAAALLLMMGSAPFLRLLCDCTDLALASYERLELQRWRPGDFTLLPPREQYLEARLEVVMYLGVPERALSGGATTYLAPEDDAAAAPALVTLPPVNNALNLVYCDAGAAGFTKYLSRMTMADDEHFYILTCTYRE
ncbi:prolyl 3-hydroxylase sudestada1 [Plutella xylostella]|uniref:prolyl 3-hydroxylase sudestada1 n=1 Tax=Plutella xylostella TaxID=51655 RepID=UPI0020327DC3|nr:prolyl 3-hydroxylase sudestada1 [Plutella xylostella]